jgi:hypothetical protein
MKTEQKQAGWGFLILWVLASAFGMFFGFFAGFYVGALSDALGNMLKYALVGIEIGMVVGFMQWLVLRRHLPGMGWWIPTNSAGLCCLLIMGPIDAPLVTAGIIALCGAVTGILQWLVLRGKVSRAGWLILANAASWGLLCLLIMNLPSSNLGGDLMAMLLMTTAVAMLGAVTGGVMVWLLRQRKNNEEKLNPNHH